tara:strand:+ start:252 stop:431 length:180 start_codon:yes stop_codon:yes gene_type:complete
MQIERLNKLFGAFGDFGDFGNTKVNGGLVKWDHVSMAWISHEFDSRILHHQHLIIKENG